LEHPAGHAVKSGVAVLSLFLRRRQRVEPGRIPDWRGPAECSTITGVNQESLERANAFLAAVSARATAGELVDLSPAEIGREIGVEEPLAAARAIRALLARRRLESVDGRYRLLDARPIDPGEREQVPRPRRAKGAQAPDTGRSQRSTGRGTSYSDIGREAVDRLIELGREVGTLRGALRTAREEAREAQAARDDAERRASGLAARTKELEARAEMAESNLRTLLAAAKGAGRDSPVGDTEMEAILGVLKGAPNDHGPGEAAASE
jgi:hypothetical protein